MFMVVIPILITPLLIIGSIKFQEYQNKKSEEKILKIAYINESEDSLTKQLLSDLKELEGFWPENVLTMQKNWIGESSGAELFFKIAVSNHIINVFTTRPDTIFGATYCAVAMDHPLAISLIEYKSKNS